MALRLGDETAKNAGRLTLNPLNHIDPFGSVLFPLLLKLINSPVVFGWAKPVPYNPFALYKDPKYGPLKVALVGPFSNLALAVFFSLLIRFGENFFGTVVIALFSFIVFLNCVLAVFNLVPVPPLDGSKILTIILPPRYALALESLGNSGILILFLFLYFLSNLVFYLAFNLFGLLSGGRAAEIFIKFFGS